MNVILDNVMEDTAAHDPAMRNCGTLHSKVVPDLQITTVWPANINAITEAFLRFVYSCKFEPTQVITLLPTAIQREKDLKNSPCHLIMYIHMVH